MALTYANGRNQFSNSDWNITVNSTGNLTPKTIYLSLQAQNRIGKNLLLKSSLITVPNNGRIIVTINSSALLPNEGWRYYCIGLSNTNDDADFIQVALIPLYSNGTLRTFPLTLEFSQDFQLLYEADYNKPSDLPAYPIHGMRVAVTKTENDLPLGYIYEYNSFSTSTADGINVLPSNAGKWLVIGNYTTYVGDVRGADGCKQDLRYVNNVSVLDIPEYAADGTISEKVVMWLENDTAVEVPAGYRIYTSVYSGAIDKTKLFSKKIIIDYQGYINVNTAVKRTTYLANAGNTFISIGTFLLDADYPVIVLDDTLQVNEALILGFSLKMSAIEVSGYLPQTTVEIYPEFTESVGVSLPTLSNTESFIRKDGDNRYIVPSLGLIAKALSGSGVVKGRSFPLLPEMIVSGFSANTANQPVLINGNGVCYTSNLGNIPDDAIPRAVVSTISGESKASSYSSSVTITGSTSALSVIVSHPCDNAGNGTIRNNLADVVADNNKGLFNPLYVNIYIKRNSDNVIKKFTGNIVLADPTQTINILDFNSGTTVANLPTSDFGLFNPVSCTASSISGGSNFTATSYVVAFSYVYDGNQITNIRHSGNYNTTNLVVTTKNSELDRLSSYDFWKEPVSTLQNLENIDVTTYEHNSVTYVKTEEDLFIYDKFSTATPDGTDIIAPNIGIGNWLRIELASSGSGTVGSIDIRDSWLFA
jgi:hypothetical protein